MTSPSRSARGAGTVAGSLGADSLTNGLPSAEGSSTLATVSAGSMLSLRTESLMDAP